DKLSIIFTIVLAVLVLHETVTMKAVVGCALIGIGTLMMVM
ncbi:MAG: EamA family transporter, partial [Phascolarctobacterium sp.]|nr:EamA family transporter [Phascolarctobacterium sp.]